MEERFKNAKGITVVSLVVTIIILIILAGVSINAIVGTDGLITIAKRAKENIEFAQIEEQAHLNELYTQIKNQNIIIDDIINKPNYNGEFLWNSAYIYYYGKNIDILGDWEINTSGAGTGNIDTNNLYLYATQGTVTVTTKRKIDLSSFSQMVVNCNLKHPHYSWTISFQTSTDKENWTNVITSSAYGTAASSVPFNMAKDINTVEPVYIRVLLNTTGGETSLKVYSIGFESENILTNNDFLWKNGYIYYNGVNSKNIDNWQMDFNNGGIAKQNTNNLYLYASQGIVTATTKNKIDLSNFTQISVNYDLKHPHYNWTVSFQISTDKENWTNVITSSAYGTASSGNYLPAKIIQNINIEEPVYVRIFLNATGGETNLKVYSINFISNKPVV